MRLLDRRGFENTGIVDEDVDTPAEQVQRLAPQRLRLPGLRQVGGDPALAGARGVADDVVAGERGDDRGADSPARASDQYVECAGDVQKSTLS